MLLELKHLAAHSKACGTWRCSTQLEAVDRKQESVAERMEGMQVGLKWQRTELQGMSDTCNKLLKVSACHS